MRLTRIYFAIWITFLVFLCIALGACNDGERRQESTRRTASALEMAVFDNSPSRVRAELQKKLPLDFKNSIGVNLLRYSVSEELMRNHPAQQTDRVLKDSDEIVQLLIDAGVDINVESSDGSPVIYSAIANNRFFAITLLLRHGARLNSYDRNHMTPLMLSIYHCNIPVTKLLILNGAPIDSKNDHGESVLTIAGERCSSVLYLLRNETPKTRNSGKMR